MFPPSVLVGPHTYTVEEVPRKKIRVGVTGEVDNETNEIRIYQKCAPSCKVEVLIHEVLHAILSGTELNREELVVTILAVGLTAFIRDNPKVIKYLQDTLTQ